MLRRLFLMLLLLSAATISFAQKSADYLVPYTVENKDGEFMGYKNRNGKVIIPAKFITVMTEKFYKMAIVLNKSFRWVGIDRNEKEVLEPVMYDNGPDYVQEGLFRFKEKYKMGFANLDGLKVIPARFDFVEPFDHGLAMYLIGGKMVPDQSGEHSTWEGAVGEGYINKYGQEFSKVGELRKGYRKAWIKATNQPVLLNGKGKVVKYYK